MKYMLAPLYTSIHINTILHSLRTKSKQKYILYTDDDDDVPIYVTICTK